MRSHDIAPREPLAGRNSGKEKQPVSFRSQIRNSIRSRISDPGSSDLSSSARKRARNRKLAPAFSQFKTLPVTLLSLCVLSFRNSAPVPFSQFRPRNEPSNFLRKKDESREEAKNRKNDAIDSRNPFLRGCYWMTWHQRTPFMWDPLSPSTLNMGILADQGHKYLSSAYKS